MFHREAISLDEIGKSAAAWLKDGKFTLGDIELIVNHMQVKDVLLKKCVI